MDRLPLKALLFFGDREYEFFLSLKCIAGLQSKTGASIGSIHRRAMLGDIEPTELIETVRFGLIGGGLSAKDADEVVTTWGDVITLNEWLETATDILNAVIVGYTPKEGGADTGGKPKPTTDGLT